MCVGYAGVSAQDQPLDVQHEALPRSGCEKVFDDSVSGRVVDRAGFQRALDVLRECDTLIVWRLDPLGRGVKQLVDLVSSFDQQGISFVNLTDSIDASMPAGRFFFHVMASPAGMERELTVERNGTWLETALHRCRRGGRRRIMTDGHLEAGRQLVASGIPAREVAANLGVSIAVLYRWVPVRETSRG